MLRYLHNKLFLTVDGFRDSVLRLSILFILLVLSITTGYRKHAEVPPQIPKETQTGLASYYGRGFHGKETSSGETFNKHEMVAAHPTYPTGTRARVTNIENKTAVEVRIIDRGPTRVNQAEGVIIDLSEGAATELEMLKDGRVRVKVEVLEWGDNTRK